MNREIVLSTLRERLAVPARLFPLLMLFLLPLMYAYLPVDVEQPLGPFLQAMLIWTLGAGIVGEDASSGVMLLVFARPIRRSEYVFSKWAALAVAAAVFLVSQDAAYAAIRMWRGREMQAAAVLARMLEHLTLAAGASAVLVLFSCLIQGSKEITGIMIAWFATWVLRIVGQVWAWPVATAVGEELSASILPSFSPVAAFAGDPAALGAVAAWASTLVLALGVAVFVLSRKELSYAA
ncbi:MAG: hypothetical protein AAB368_12890, partial [bacterium]